MFASFWGDAAKEAGFDIKERIPLPTERITTSTAGYEGYFDLPVKEEVPVSKSSVTVESPEPKSLSDLSPDLQGKLSKSGFDLDAFLKGAGKKIGIAAAIETGRQFIEAPLETGSAIAKELGLELGARAVGFSAGPAAAVPMILAPTQTAGPELSELPPPQQDFIPAREVEEESPTEQMARIATEDAGFMQRNREPEAAPVANQGFVAQPQN